MVVDDWLIMFPEWTQTSSILATSDRMIENVTDSWFKTSILTWKEKVEGKTENSTTADYSSSNRVFNCNAWETRSFSRLPSPYRISLLYSVYTLRIIERNPREWDLHPRCPLLFQLILWVKRCCQLLSKVLAVIVPLVITVLSSPSGGEPFETSNGMKWAVKLHQLVDPWSTFPAVHVADDLFS